MRHALLTAAVCLMATACGDDSDEDLAMLADASCAMRDLQPSGLPDGGPASACVGTPCGGDLTGTWQVQALCATGSGDGSYLGCKAGTLTYQGEAVTGTFTFAADGSVTTNASEHFVGQAHLPLSCYGLDDCGTLASLAATKGIMASCVAACTPDNACDCELDLQKASVMLQGKVVTDGAGGLTLTLGAETIPGHYCVNGEQLWIQGTRFGGVDYRYAMHRVP